MSTTKTPQRKKQKKKKPTIAKTVEEITAILDKWADDGIEVAPTKKAVKSVLTEEFGDEFCDEDVKTALDLLKNPPIDIDDEAIRLAEAMSHDNLEFKTMTGVLAFAKSKKREFSDVTKEIASLALAHHRNQLRQAKEEQKEEKKRELPSSIEDVLNLPDVEKMNGGCFFGLTKMFGNKEVRFTFYLDDKSTSRKLARPRFVPQDTQPSSINFMDIDPEPTIDSVLNSLIGKYRRYLFFLDEWVFVILALAAISTYFREVFDTYPYFDFYAPELDCGKTTAMNCLVWSCFYGLSMVDPTGPVIFRAVDSCKSVIGIDELDNLLKDPDTQGRFLGLLNSAYQKGIVAYRIDMEKQGMPIPYDPFGLKAFTHIKAIPPSIPNRSIIINMVRAEGNLALLTNADVFRDERDMLYNLRLNIANEVKTIYASVLSDGELGLSNRARQKFVPLLTIAKLISDDCYDRTRVWALAYVERHAAHRIDELMRTLIEAIVRLNPDDSDVVLKTVTDEFNNLCVERELITMKKDGTPRTFGSKRILRMLSTVDILKSDKRTDNKVHVLISPKMIRYWAKVYGIKNHGIEGIPPVEGNFDNFDNLDNSRGISEIIQSTQITLHRVYGGFIPENFIDPVDIQMPQILVKLVILWEKHNTTLDKGIRTTIPREHDILFKGLEAGYVTKRMPGNWWILTQTALEDTLSTKKPEGEDKSDEGHESLPKESEGESKGIDVEEFHKEQPPDDLEKPRPKKAKKSKKPRPLLRTVKEFSDWLERLPNAGQRGFKESDIERAFGKDYFNMFSKYIEKRWIEQRQDSKDVWWISSEGTIALAGGYRGTEGG